MTIGRSEKLVCQPWPTTGCAHSLSPARFPGVHAGLFLYRASIPKTRWCPFSVLTRYSDCKSRS